MQNKGQTEGGERVDVYRCPHCGAEIANTGDKAALHRTFCKGSYENFSEGNLLTKSTMSGIFELLKVDLKDPPRGVIVRKCKDGKTTITFTSRTVLRPELGLVAAAILGYFGGAMPLYLKVVMLAGAVLIFLYSVCSTIYHLYAKWELKFGDGLGTFYCGVGRFGRTVGFCYNHDSTVSAVTEEDFGRTVVQTLWYVPALIASVPAFIVSSLAGHILETRFVAKEGITVATNGVRTHFGGTIPKGDAMKYMAAYLLREAAA
jgi:hypothetical protein